MAPLKRTLTQSVTESKEVVIITLVRPSNPGSSLVTAEKEIRERLKETLQDWKVEAVFGGVV